MNVRPLTIDDPAGGYHGWLALPVNSILGGDPVTWAETGSVLVIAWPGDLLLGTEAVHRCVLLWVSPARLVRK